MAKNRGSKGRRKGAISSSYGALTKHAELEHLDGLSYIHFLDVQSNWEHLNPEEATAERNHAALLESYFFGGGGRFDLIGNLWFGDDLEGVSAAAIMPSTAWKANIRKADDARRHWHDGTRTRTAPRGEFSGNLGKIFCRLTPWNALAAGQFLTREDALEAVLEVAIRIEKETGLKVLGAVIHRETDHDIHVHFIVSKIGPVEIGEDLYSEDYIKKLTTDQRKIIREERRKRGDDISLKAVDEELASRRKNGKMKDPTNRKAIEYQVIDRTKAPRRGIVCMGQQHCSKTNLWEASGRDPAVAAVEEGHSIVSFRSVVQDAAAVAPDRDPAHKYFDYWLAKKWNQAVVERLPEEVRDQMPEVARRAAQRYVEEGSSLPNPTLDAAREKEKQIIRAAARAASGIEKLASEEAERIIAEAQTKLRDTQSELEKTLERNRQHEAALKEFTVTATTAIKNNKVVRINLDEREKALILRENTLQIGEKNLGRQQIKLDTQARNLTTEMEELRNERTRLRRIPIALVAEKLGFVLDDQGNLSAELLSHTKTIFKYRLVLTGESFEAYVYHHLRAGDYAWVHHGKGKGAIDLMKTFMQKRPVLEACNRLAEYFPESKDGIVIELLEDSNPELWKELAPQNPVKPPPADPNLSRERDSKSAPDMT